MLLVFGTHGSPGATTTAYMVASKWAEQTTDVCFMEADPTGGTLHATLSLTNSQNLVSVVTARQFDRQAILNNAEQLAGNSLNILSLPNSSRAAWEIVERLSTHSQALRMMSRRSPFVLDCGRVFDHSPAIRLMEFASKAVIIVREGYLPSISTVQGAYSSMENYIREGKVGLITVGEQVWGNDEYKKITGIEVVGSIAEHPQNYVDLNNISASPDKHTRKFQASVDYMADRLFSMMGMGEMETG